MNPVDAGKRPATATLAVAAFSLSNVLLLRLWFELNHLQHSPLYQYYLQRPAEAADYFAALLTMALLAALLFLPLRAATGGHGRIAAGAGAVLIGLAAIASLYLAAEVSERLPEPLLWRTGDHLARTGDSPLFPLGLAAAALLIAALPPLSRCAVACSRSAITVLLLLAPFGALMAGSAAGHALRFVWDNEQPASHTAMSAPAPGTTTALPGATRRAVVMVFDELDWRLAFEQRPAGLALPAFDRLRARGVSATHAFPPSNATVMSLPAMLSGRMVAGIRPHGWAGLEMDFLTGGTVEFPDPESLFHRLAARGVSSGAAGWYLPYCREFPALTDCAQASAYNYATSIVPEGSFGAALTTQWRQIVPWTLGYAGLRQQRLMERLVQMLADPRLGLVFAHLPVPHFPWIPDDGAPETGRSETHFPVSGGPQSYFGNLRIADAALGRTLELMERYCAGCLLVTTSDHWWRWSRRHDGITDRRVPFLAVRIGDTAPATVDRAFSNIAAAGLVEQFLAGRIEGNTGIAAWLERDAPHHEPVMASWMTDEDRAAH